MAELTPKLTSDINACFLKPEAEQEACLTQVQEVAKDSEPTQEYITCRKSGKSSEDCYTNGADAENNFRIFSTVSAAVSVTGFLAPEAFTFHGNKRPGAGFTLTNQQLTLPQANRLTLHDAINTTLYNVPVNLGSLTELFKLSDTSALATDNYAMTILPRELASKEQTLSTLSLTRGIPGKSGVVQTSAFAADALALLGNYVDRAYLSQDQAASNQGCSSTPGGDIPPQIDENDINNSDNPNELPDNPPAGECNEVTETFVTPAREGMINVKDGNIAARIQGLTLDRMVEQGRLGGSLIGLGTGLGLAGVATLLNQNNFYWQRGPFTTQIDSPIGLAEGGGTTFLKLTLPTVLGVAAANLSYEASSNSADGMAAESIASALYDLSYASGQHSKLKAFRNLQGSSLAAAAGLLPALVEAASAFDHGAGDYFLCHQNDSNPLHPDRTPTTLDNAQCYTTLGLRAATSGLRLGLTLFADSKYDNQKPWVSLLEAGRVAAWVAGWALADTEEFSTVSNILSHITPTPNGIAIGGTW